MRKNSVFVVLGVVAFLTPNALAALTPGALIDMDAYYNAGHPNNWDNNGSLGGTYDQYVFGDCSVDPGNDGPAGPYWYKAYAPGGAFISGSSTVAPTLDSFTYEMWVRKDGAAPAEEEGLFGFRNAAGTQKFLGMWQNGDGSGLDIYVKGSNNGTGAFYDDVYTITTGQWTQIALTLSSSTQQLKVYVNGSLVNTVSVAWNPDSSTPMTNCSFHTASSGEYWRYFNGGVSRIRLYGSVLDATAIADNYAYGNTTPEPVTLSLLSIAGLVSLIRRRRR